MLLLTIMSVSAYTFYEDFSTLDTAGFTIYGSGGDQIDTYSTVNSGYEHRFDVVASCGGTGCRSEVYNLTNGVRSFGYNSGTFDSYNVDWLVLDLNNTFTGSEMYFYMTYNWSNPTSHRNVKVKWQNTTGAIKTASFGQYGVTNFTLSSVTGDLSTVAEVLEFSLGWSHGAGSIHFQGEGQFYLYELLITDYQIAGDMPVITDIDYSALSIDYLYYDTLYVNATASDLQADDIFWAYDCDYSGTSSPVRVSEEYMDNGTNVTELSERFNLISSIEFGGVYLVDGLVGYALNLTMTGGIQDFYRNATSTYLTSNLISTHFIIGFDGYFSGETDGVFMAGVDSTGLLMWGLVLDHNESLPSGSRQSIYRMDGSGNFHLLTTSSDVPDRVYVDVDLDAQTYSVKVDKNFDGIIDYISTSYPLVSSVSNYHGTYGFTMGSSLLDGQDFFDLSVVTPTRDVWLDTLFVEHTDLPAFSLSPSNSIQYQCVYDGIGTYEVRTWVTDDNHANNYTSYESQSIQVYQSSTPPSVDCDGFTKPACTGNCWFYDDFNYNYSIACNSWNGANNKFPINNQLEVEQSDMDALSIWLQYNDIPQDPIYAEQYNTYTIDFDFTAMTDERVSFVAFDDNIDLVMVYVYWENEIMKVYQVGNPSTLTITNYTNGVQHHVEMVVDFNNQEVTYTIDDDYDNSITANFFDSGIDIETAGYFYFTPVDFNDGYLKVDNFMIYYGNPNPDFDGELPTSPADEYQFTTSMFCAINWSATNTSRFSEEHCQDRGYNTNYPLLSLCIPRACISDTISWTFMKATDNIFVTIVIVTAFILIAPLLIAGRRRR